MVYTEKMHACVDRLDPDQVAGGQLTRYYRYRSLHWPGHKER